MSFDTLIRSCLCVTTLLVLARTPPLEAQRPPDPGSFTEDSLTATRLNATVRLRIAMPLEYSPEKPQADSFPVVIMLGASDALTYTSLVASLRLLNSRFGGAVPPVIIVGVASSPASPWPRTSAAMDSLRPGAGGADSLVEFLATDLIPFIKARYPTRPHTTIVGHSVHGFFALYALAKTPGAYNAAVAVSPAFWWLNENVNDGELANDLARHIARETGSRIYIGVGEFDPGPIRRGTEVFVEALRKNQSKAQIKHDVLSDDNHQTSRQPGFVDGVRWVFDPVSLARNPVYALMGGYARDLDTAALSRAYVLMKARYAQGARSLGLPVALPAAFLAATMRLPPIEKRDAPIPIVHLLCQDYSAWYGKESLPTVCTDQ